MVINLTLIYTIFTFIIYHIEFNYYTMFRKYSSVFAIKIRNNQQYKYR